MQVGGDGVREESCQVRRDGDIPVKARLPEADIENDFPLSPFHHRGIQLSVFQQLFAMSGKAMRVDIAGPQLVEKQGVDVAVFRDLAEIDHHRQSGCVPGLDRAIDRRPARAGVMRGLEADNEIRILFGDARGVLRIHLGGIVFSPATHPRRHNVQERQDARACALDEVLAEIGEFLPAG